MHYNKDHRRHQQHLMTNNICITEHTCQVCCKKVKSKSSPCKQHLLQIPFKCDETPRNSAVSCCFLSQYNEGNAKIGDNEDLYVAMKIFVLNQNIDYKINFNSLSLLQLFCGHRFIWPPCYKMLLLSCYIIRGVSLEKLAGISCYSKMLSIIYHTDVIDEWQIKQSN